MTKLKKPAGAYLIGIAVIVAAFFITNPLLSGLLDPAKVWAVLDIMMLIGLLTALAFQLRRQEETWKRDRNRTTP